jgi:hypothetical protein
VGLGALVGKLDRWAGKFNRWFGGAAVANNVADSGAMSGGSPAVVAAAVVAVLGVFKRERSAGDWVVV